MEKPCEVKHCFPGEMTSQPGSEEEKIAQPWGTDEAFQTQGREAVPSSALREKAGQTQPGWHVEDVKRGVRSGARSL